MSHIETKETSYGLGVFAKSFIPEGTIWWEEKIGENTLIISHQQYKTLYHSEIRQEISPLSFALWQMLITYTYYSTERDALVLILDDGRYVNHSDDPNSECRNGRSVALRDIQVGEEITESYKSYDNYCWSEPWDEFEEETMMIDAEKRAAYDDSHAVLIESPCWELETYVGTSKSEIKGRGLFVPRKLNKGDTIWVDAPGVTLYIPHLAYLTLKSSTLRPDSLSENFLKAILSFSYYDSRIDSLCIALDNGRFINHCPAEENSTAITEWRKTVDHTVASRDLEEHTEIEDDYSEYDFCPWEDIIFEWESFVPSYLAQKQQHQQL